jgi:hypothetical protein
MVFRAEPALVRAVENGVPLFGWEMSELKEPKEY